MEWPHFCECINILTENSSEPWANKSPVPRITFILLHHHVYDYMLQVNLADFYRKEAKRKLLPFHAANLIQSRKLYIDDEDLESEYDQLAVESTVVDTVLRDENVIKEIGSNSLTDKKEGWFDFLLQQRK